ncbi:MAG: hypothetical protein HYZ63_02665, partial [Candidatus Andersenbacteria bacterium]|nr:hypothetical protein [Candidatus Andersenbacteria bacterium]
MRRAWVAFWNFYERHYTLNVTASLGLFLFQMVHLFWLTTNVILVRILGQPLFEFTGIWQY